MKIAKRGLSKLIMGRSFARKVVRNLPKMKVNKLKKDKEVTIEDFLISEEEVFLSKLIRAAKDHNKVMKIFDENLELIGPRDASFALKSFLIKKNGRNIASFRKLNRFNLDEKEEKFVEICLEKILDNLEDLDENEIKTILKITSIANVLPIEKNLKFFEFFRKNNFPINYYASIGLLEHFLTTESCKEELNYTSKNLGILMSYDGFLPNDQDLKMKLLNLLLRSEYADISILEILEDSIIEFQNIQNFEILDVINVLEGYTLTQFKGPNYDLVDIFSGFILSKTDSIDVKNAKNILYFCQKLKYSSGNLLNTLGKWLFNYVNNPQNLDLKQIGEGEKNEKSLKGFISKEEELDNLTSCLYSLLYLDYANNEIFNSILMKVMLDLESASPKVLYRLCFCHSKFTFLRLKEVEEGKKMYYRRSIKALKKLNDQFYEMAIPIIEGKLESFHPLDLVSISFCSQRPQVKKLAVKRLMLDFNIKCLDYMALEIENKLTHIPQGEFKKAYFQMINISKKLAYNDKQKKILLECVRKHQLNLKSLEADFGMYSIQA